VPLVPVDRAELPLVVLAVFALVDEPDVLLLVVLVDLEEPELLADVLDAPELLVLVDRAEVPVLLVAVLVSVFSFSFSFAAALVTSERSWPALRTETPFVLDDAVRVTRCSNDSFGCCFE